MSNYQNVYDEARTRAISRAIIQGTARGMRRWMRLFKCPKCDWHHWYSTKPAFLSRGHYGHFENGKPTCRRCQRLRKEIVGMEKVYPEPLMNVKAMLRT